MAVQTSALNVGLPMAGATWRRRTWALALMARALIETARSYLRSFWLVFRAAFPLMILAAVLGAFAVELIPQQALIAKVSVLGIVVVSIISVFLPVPMAFDVAIAYILMAHGVPLPYVAVILCTLGIISVYSLSVIGNTISWRTAAATYGAVVAIGIVAGIAVRFLGRVVRLFQIPLLEHDVLSHNEPVRRHFFQRG